MEHLYPLSTATMEDVKFVTIVTSLILLCLVAIVFMLNIAVLSKLVSRSLRDQHCIRPSYLVYGVLR